MGQRKKGDLHRNQNLMTFQYCPWSALLIRAKMNAELWGIRDNNRKCKNGSLHQKMNAFAQRVLCKSQIQNAEFLRWGFHLIRPSSCMKPSWIRVWFGIYEPIAVKWICILKANAPEWWVHLSHNKHARCPFVHCFDCGNHQLIAWITSEISPQKSIATRVNHNLDGPYRLAAVQVA